jgi:hypothetical protein
MLPNPAPRVFVRMHPVQSGGVAAHRHELLHTATNCCKLDNSKDATA